MMPKLGVLLCSSIGLFLLHCKTIRKKSELSSSEVLGADVYCKAKGYTPRAFVVAPESVSLNTLAADFVVPTTDGDFQLSKNFSGCDSYLIIQDFPRQERGAKRSLWSSDVAEFIKALPLNTHVLFVSTADDPEAVALALKNLSDSVETTLKAMPLAEQSQYRSRLHYVTKSVSELSSWVGDLMRDPGFGIGIDRFQRIRYVGSYADPRRVDEVNDWFAPNLVMAANEAIYYNFEEGRESALQSEGATVLPIFKGEAVDNDGKNKFGYAELNLPNAEDMAKFDSMEFDLELGCPGEGEYGTCPAWDSTVSVYLCEAQNTEKCDMEIGRWITTYHRKGRWVHDVSPLLPLLKDGGKRRFAFFSDQTYNVFLNMRLLNRKLPLRPLATLPLFTGGKFDLDYNKRAPLSISLPAGASKVELVSAITGHGMEEPGNCAEFCDTTHRFFINDKAIERSFPEVENSFGCMEQVKNGTVPNQFGTWWYGRSGWCPGKEVPLVRQDISSLVRLGQKNEFRYEGLFKGKPYTSGAAAIFVSSFIVIYGPQR